MRRPRWCDWNGAGGCPAAADQVAELVHGSELALCPEQLSDLSCPQRYEVVDWLTDPLESDGCGS